MDSRPTRAVQADALDLPLAERARLAYRLLASFDAELTGGRLAQEPDAAAEPVAEPAQPDVQPVLAALREVEPEAAVEPPAPDATEAEIPPAAEPRSPLLDPDGRLGDSYADAVAALVDRLGAKTDLTVRKPVPSSSAVKAEIPTAPDVQADGPAASVGPPDVAPPRSSPAVRTSEPDLFADWDEQARKGYETQLQSLPVGVGVGWPEWGRGLAATTIAGGVAALLGLGIFIKARDYDDPYTIDPMSSVVAPAESPGFREIPTIQTPQVQAVAASMTIEPSLATERPLVTEPPAVTQRPSTPTQPATNASAGTTRPAATRPAATSSAVTGRPAPAANAPEPTARRNAAEATRPAAVNEPVRFASVDNAINNTSASTTGGTPSTPVASSILPLRSMPSRGEVVVPVTPALSSISLSEPAGRRNAAPSSLASSAAQPHTAPPSLASSAGAAEPPVAAQFDVAPEVRNAARVQAVLERAYPPALRNFGVGGKAEMWFYVSRQGAVDSVLLKRTTGNRQLDQAALRVAESFEFTPGRRGNEPAEGWVAVEIVFTGS
jgi:TonB family protein